MKKRKKFLIIDSNSLIHRAFHALPPLKTKKGELVNACYGFSLVFLKALREIKPDFVIACFDFPGPTFRHKEFKEYKAKRPKAPNEIYQQIPKVKEILEAFNVPIFEKEGFEADDIIGTVVFLVKKKQVFPEPEIIILSGDLDTLQLVDEHTKVFTLKKGIKDVVFYGKKEIQEKYHGLTPSQLIDFKGLKGDPSDNIPGVPGIGEKTAIELIKEFGSLENLYTKLQKNSERIKKIKKKTIEALKKYKDQAFFSKKLAQIRCDVPLELDLQKARFEQINIEKVKTVFEKFEFYTLVKRLKEIFQQNFELLQPQKSLAFFEKKVKAQDEVEKLFKEGVLSRTLYEIEKELTPIIREMERNGILLDVAKVKKVSEKLEKELQKIKKEIYRLSGVEFNINSPSQVSEILFQKLKIPTKDLKKTLKGAISTGAEELKKLKDFHPIVGLILKYREIFKFKTGFVDTLPKLIDKKDGRLHPKFHQFGAETGRMSCSEPNLQNIPKKEVLREQIRECFYAPEGFVFLSFDWSQMELKIAAFLSQDKNLIELFEKGEDIHKLTALAIFNPPDRKITEKMRELAKTLNYGVLYGISPKGFAQRADISLEEAKEFMEKYFEKFPQLLNFFKEQIKRAKTKGYVETYFGRRKFLPEINSIDLRLRSQAERIARNFPIQGTAADICKIAMVEIAKRNILDENCKLVLQIHDELLFEVKETQVEEKGKRIKEIMQNVIKMKPVLEVEVKKGKRWGDLQSFLE